jgi:hypothetical protein
MVDYTLVRSKRQTKKARLEAQASSGPPNPNTVEKDGLTTSYKTHMRVEFTVATNPDNGTTMFNAYNAMKDFTEVLLSCDSNMVLRNQRNMDHTITKIEEFPAGQAAFKRFFTDGTMAGYKKDSNTIFFGFFIDCTYSDSEDARFSMRNPGLWAYVKAHNIFLRSHGHETFTIQKVGFITMVPLKHIFRMDYEITLDHIDQTNNGFGETRLLEDRNDAGPAGRRKEHAQKTLVEKGMLTEEFEESKRLREFSKITTNPQAQVFLSNHEESLISKAKYTGRKAGPDHLRCRGVPRFSRTRKPRKSAAARLPKTSGTHATTSPAAHRIRQQPSQHLQSPTNPAANIVRSRSSSNTGNSGRTG